MLPCSCLRKGIPESNFLRNYCLKVLPCGMVGPHQGVGREGTAVVYGDWIFFFFSYSSSKPKLESKTASPQVINTG